MAAVRIMTAEQAQQTTHTKDSGLNGRVVRTQLLDYGLAGSWRSRSGRASARSKARLRPSIRAGAIR